MAKTTMSTITGVLLFAAVTYGLLVAVTYFAQPRLLFFPISRLDFQPEQAGLRADDVYFTTTDDVRLHGWYLPAPNAVSTLLFFHGNAGNISHRLDSLKIFHQLGVNVFIFDYRGYGRSQGSPSESGTYQDALAAWTYLVEERRTDPRRIVFFGRSLGAAVATWLATQVTVQGLILESAFTSVPDLGAHHYPWLPVRWLSRFRYHTLQSLRGVHVPILIVHSRHDRIVPFRHGQRLFDAAREPKAFLELAGGHNDGFLISGQTYTDGLKNFLTALR